MPQPTTKAVLYIKDSSSSNNYRLFNYLEEMLPRTMRAGLQIDHRIAETNNAEYFKEQNIYGFPALILNSHIYVGNQDIENILNQIATRPQKPKDDDDDVNDFLIKSVTTNSDGSRFVPPKARGVVGSSKSLSGQQSVAPNDDDEDDIDAESKKLQSDIQKALRDRQARDKNFGKGMEPSSSNKGTTRQIQEGPNRPEGLQNPNLRQTREPKPRPSNIKPPVLERKVIARPTNPDDALLNKLYENQG